MTLVLGKLLDELGPSALDLVAGRIVASTPIRDIGYYDPLEIADVSEGAILLCPGVAGATALDDLFREASLRKVVAVVVRSASGAPRDAVLEVADKGVAVFEFAEDTTWRQLIVAVHQAFGDEMSPGRGGDLRGTVDLFGLANVVAQMVEAPVTIEDLGSKVLAFSDNQGRADEARKAAVLARQVSQRDSDYLRSEGFFKRIYARDEVVHVPTEGVGGTLPRAVIRLHHQGRVLGSIWAATNAGPSPTLHAAMLEAASMVAPSLAEIAATERAAMGATTAQVLALMRGGRLAREEAHRLGLSRTRWLVVAVASQEREVVESVMRETALAFAAQLQVAFPKARSTLSDGRLYAVVPLLTTGDATVVDAIQNFVDKWSAQVLVAVLGDAVDDPVDLSASRQSADHALTAFLLQRSSASTPVLVRASELQDAVLVQRLSDIIAAEHVDPTGALQRLLAYDAQHATDLVASLTEWLDSFGDVQAAAAVLHVHVNTFRYRLRRVGEIARIDLADSATRFSLMLQLRVFTEAPGATAAPSTRMEPRPID